MLLALAAALFLSPQVATPPSTEPDVVVIGRRLKDWSGKYSIRGSKMKCATKKSTGDREIDAIGCMAFETCAARLESRIAQSDARDLERGARMAMKTAIKQDLSSCVASRRIELIDELAERRYKARQGGAGGGN